MTSLRRLPFALAALFGVVAAIAACAYAISAWQVFGFASHVWRLPAELCFAAAFVADLLSLAGLFATYLLRRAKLGVQLYAWFVFLAMTGLSIAAAESYASWRFAPEWERPNVTFDARVASGAIVVALALAVHLLILCRNHISGSTEDAPDAARPAADRGAGRAATAAPVKPSAPEPLPPVRKEPVETGKTQVKTAAKPRKDDGGKTERRRQFVLDVVAKRKTAAEVAAAEGVSERAVQLWVKGYRDRHPAPAMIPPPSLEAPTSTTSTNVRPINGAAPEVEVTG